MRKAILLWMALALGGLFALAQGWVDRGPIYIYGDAQFTWENGVLKEGDPGGPLRDRGLDHRHPRP